jgi:hypothetical protein
MDEVEALRERVRKLEEAVERMRGANAPLVRWARALAWMILLVVVAAVFLVLTTQQQGQIIQIQMELRDLKQQRQGLR